MKKFLWLAFLLSACGSRELKTPITPSYFAIQQTVIGPKCVVCHQSLSTYEGVLNIVNAGNPNQSDFYRVIKDGSMPEWSPSLSDAEVQAVYQWIANGALHD